jgi:hypothetical protein
MGEFSFFDATSCSTSSVQPGRYRQDLMRPLAPSVHVAEPQGSGARNRRQDNVLAPAVPAALTARANHAPPARRSNVFVLQAEDASNLEDDFEEDLDEDFEDEYKDEDEDEDDFEEEEYFQEETRPRRVLTRNMRPREGVVYTFPEGGEFSIRFRRTYGAWCKKCHKLSHATRQHLRFDAISPARE